MKCPRFLFPVFFILACLVWKAQPVHAATINVDIGFGGLYSGVGAAPDTGTFWNMGPNGSTLKDSNGNTTEVTISLTNFQAYNDSPSGPQANGNTAAVLLRDYVSSYPAAQPANIAISGLSTANSYDVYLYGISPTAGTTFTLSMAPALAHKQRPVQTRQPRLSPLVKITSFFTMRCLRQGLFEWISAAPATDSRSWPLPSPAPMP